MTKEKLLKLSKILVLVFMGLTFLGVLLPDAFVIGIQRHHGIRLSPFQAIIRWFNFASFVILPIAVYFNRGTFKKIAIYFCLPVAIIYLCMIGEILPWLTSWKGYSLVGGNESDDWFNVLMRNGAFRGIIFVLTSLAQVGVIGLLIHRDWKVIKFKVKDILPFLLILLGSIFTILPVYVPEIIFNTREGLLFERFGILHFGWILALALETALFIIFFRKRSAEDKYILVLILSLSLFLQYNQLFTTLIGGMNCKRLPLQLCNLSAYITLISIVFKKRNLFLFNLTLNVIGGVIALVMLDAVSDLSIIAQSNVHYIVEHNNVMLVPILCLALRVFKPIKMKDFKAFVLYFTGYFLFVLMIGSIFNAFYIKTADDFFYCNYMFMFDAETAGNLLGFTEDLFNFKLQIGSFELYYVIQPLVYIVFFALGTGMFFLLKACVKPNQELDLEAIE